MSRATRNDGFELSEKALEMITGGALLDDDAKAFLLKDMKAKKEAGVTKEEYLASWREALASGSPRNVELLADTCQWIPDEWDTV